MKVELETLLVKCHGPPSKYYYYYSPKFVCRDQKVTYYIQKDVYVNINVAGVLIPKLCMYVRIYPSVYQCVHFMAH